MRYRWRHVLGGLALTCAFVCAALFGALHLAGASAADGLRSGESASARAEPGTGVVFTAERGARPDHSEVPARVVHAQPALRQLRLALAALVAAILFLVRPRHRSRVGRVESFVAQWCSGSGSGRGPPAIRIA